MRTLPSSFVVAPAVALLVALAAPAPAHGTHQFRRVALTGDPVPGQPGAFFQWFSAAPGVGDGAPDLDHDGNVSFVGGWGGPAHALFLDRGGPLEVHARLGDPAPGTTTVFTGYPGIVPGAARIQGALTSIDGAYIVDQVTHQGVWADRAGGRQAIFLDTQQPPGTPANSRFFMWFHTLAENGAVVVNARYSTGSSSGINDHGFWRDAGAGLQTIALARTQAPGVPAGVVFGNGQAINLPAFENWDLDHDGRIAFSARLMNGGVNDFTDEGVWLEGPGGLTLVAREDDPAPGAGGGARMRGYFGFRTFGHTDNIGVIRNDAGHVAFGVRVDKGGSSAFNGMYVRRGGVLDLVVLGHYAGETPPGDPAPGFPEGTTLTRFSGAHLNDLGELAFSGAAVAPGGSVLDEEFGLWVERDGVVQLVAKNGDLAPGYGGATLRFPSVRFFFDDGTVIFSALVDEGDVGLFEADPSGAIHLIVGTSLLFDVGSGDERVVETIRWSAHASDDRTVALDLAFQGGSEGMFLATPSTNVAVEPIAGGPRRPELVASPNPFSTSTVLAFDVARESEIQLDVLDVAGRHVARVASGRFGPGRHEVPWNLGARGRALTPGLYVARLRKGGELATCKLLRVN